MKKKYEAPVAEIMEFDYEENVVASNTVMTNVTSGNPWFGNTGNKNGCQKLQKC